MAKIAAELGPGFVVEDADGERFRQLDTPGRKRWERADPARRGTSPFRDEDLEPPVRIIGRFCLAESAVIVNRRVAYWLHCDRPFGHQPDTAHHDDTQGWWPDEARDDGASE